MGQINYNEIHRVEGSTDMDIIIADAAHHGKGLGSEAIALLVDYLFEDMEIRICIIEVLAQNPKAFHAYKKAGFIWAYTYVNAGIEWRVMEIRKSVWTKRRQSYTQEVRKK
ncbi:MAG: GNAT family protein [Bacteroidota bacterium]